MATRRGRRVRKQRKAWQVLRERLLYRISCLLDDLEDHLSHDSSKARAALRKLVEGLERKRVGGARPLEHWTSATQRFNELCRNDRWAIRHRKALAALDANGQRVFRLLVAAGCSPDRL